MNVVGYTSQTITAGKWYLIATQFDAPGGTSVKLQDLIKSTFKPVKYSVATVGSTTPQIQFWDGEKYTTYYYLATAYNPLKGILPMNPVENVWSASEGTYDPDITVDIGRGAWFKVPVNETVGNSGDYTITIAGEVATATKGDIPTIAKKFNLIANPFPTALKLNDGSIDWLGSGLVPVKYNVATVGTTTPQIQVWTGDKYTTYYFLTTAYNPGRGILPMNPVANVWSASEGTYDPDSAVPVGYGFWFKYFTDENLTIKFVR